METITIAPAAQKLQQELNCKIFKHEGLICCILRMSWGGNLNGYVAITEDHPLYGKSYNATVTVPDISAVEFNGSYLGLLCEAFKQQEGEHTENQISLDMALNAHGGITYSRDNLACIEGDLLGKLWWFGFDTAHAGDLRPYQTGIDRRYKNNDEYRDIAYVEAECKKLADQLANWPK